MPSTCFLFAVESRYLSQADRSIIRVSSFSKSSCWMIKFTFIPKKLFGTWQFDFIIINLARSKSKQFSQFFWWDLDVRKLWAFILQKVQASVVERQENKFCYSFLALWNFCKLKLVKFLTFVWMLTLCSKCHSLRIHCRYHSEKSEKVEKWYVYAWHV